MSDGRELRRRLVAAGTEKRRRLVGAMDEEDARDFDADWPAWVREGQAPPDGDDWRVWVMLAGRGFGKTRAGAEWVSAMARAHPGCSIALVAATPEEARRVMIEGRSGLLAAEGPDEELDWAPSLGTVRFPSGAVAQVFSGANAEGLRGPEHHFAWCDELAKWRQAEDAWDNLMLGLRLGACPRVLVTTTPKPIALLQALIADRKTAQTGGSSGDNPHVSPVWLGDMTRRIGGTRLGRQELEGELFNDADNALWKRDMIETVRRPSWQVGGSPLLRIVIGVDPPASAGGTCGIVACGLAADPSTSSGQAVAYVLADHSIAGASPNGWARKVAAAAELWGADRVIAEKNNGGDMVGSTLASADCALPVKLVSASRGKVARAEPIAARFEAGQAWFAGRFPELEDQLCAMTSDGYRGPGSPDRADAMVWAMTELFKPRGEPRIRML